MRLVQGPLVPPIAWPQVTRCMQMSVDHAELRAVPGGSAGAVIMCPDSGNAAVRQALNVALSELSTKKHKFLIAERFRGNDEPVDKLTAPS